MEKWASDPDPEPWIFLSFPKDFWYNVTRCLGVWHFSAVCLKALHALYYTLFPLEEVPSFLIVFESCLLLHLLHRRLADLPFFFGFESLEVLILFSLWWISGRGVSPTRRWWWFLIVSSSQPRVGHEWGRHSASSSRPDIDVVRLDQKGA
jgi:hypothetical protein